MKAVRFFTGSDTYGNHVEQAQSESGKWFARYREFNGYGLAWCKWYEVKTPDFEEFGIERISGQRFKYDKPTLFWGFNRMQELEQMPRVRLPA